MDITDVRNKALFYQQNFLKTFYLVSTYYGKSFILIGERENFPHLMGIKRNVYRSNGYRNPRVLYKDILEGNPVSNRIIPNSISTTSKMYKKVINFGDSVNIFWDNKGPLAINYNDSLSATNLSNVDVLLTDIKKGYMLGWTKNTSIPVNAEINLVKYCISTWIDESDGTYNSKEKYLPAQDVELIRNVFAFNDNSELMRQKEYNYSTDEKKEILKIIERNGANLLLDRRNQRFYIEIAEKESIHCKINGIQY
ncbi:PBECR4 domain-containing protein [Faecalimonas umbilicata]|nr:PBECR4 domain-containing protein [Faecalimonas umbilicata]